MLTALVQLRIARRSSRTAPLLDSSRDGRQAAGVVCGGGSRVSDGQKPGTAAQRPQARNVPRSERGVGGRGGLWAARGGAAQDPALCERNGEAVHTRKSQPVYSGSGGSR
jgi:hypothetical protein